MIVIKVEKGKFKISISRRASQKSCHPFGDNGVVKTCINEVIP
jgi:hypothetical protein